MFKWYILLGYEGREASKPTFYSNLMLIFAELRSKYVCLFCQNFCVKQNFGAGNNATWMLHRVSDICIMRFFMVLFSTHNFSEFGYRCSRESQAYALVTLITTGYSLNIVFFPQNVVLFLNSASSAAALVFYLPGVCTHTDTKEKQRKTRARNILKSVEKKHNIQWIPCIYNIRMTLVTKRCTIYSMHGICTYTLCTKF